ncbi:hypothetical protein JHK82_027851 [Glycine max]|nr:hypothetical protein JHK82_027851 [Glycine max]
MACAPDNIKSINGSKETLKLAVRITDLWFVGTPNKSEQAEMVIIDSHNDGQFRICDHRYKLVFTGATVVRQSDLEDLPFKKYKFADFTNVIVGLFQPELLVGSYAPSVSNSLRASKLLINEAVFEIQEFRKRLSDLGIQVRSILTPSDQGSSQLSACSYSYKKVDVETAAFTCACGKYNDQPVLRYRLEVMVNHKEENTKFLLWDRECTELIGQSTNEEGDVDLNVSPQDLDKLLSYVLAFKVKVQPKFNNVVVLRYSNDIDLINAVVDMLPDAEAPILDSDDPFQLESQSVSVTANHDPFLGLPLTPTKRITFDDCDDEPKSSQILPAHLSSNKLARHDQIE